MIERYRHDVHELYPEGRPRLSQPVQRRLGRPFPDFAPIPVAVEWCGVVSGCPAHSPAAELAPASVEASDVIVFADGPATTDHWAFLVQRDNGAVFGRWEAEAQRFEPLHTRFDRWLAGTIKILDEGLRGEDELLDARLDVDPQSAWLALADARRALASDRRPRARALLERATEQNPDLIEAWIALGRVVLADDPAAARAIWLRALRDPLPCDRLTRSPTPP